MNKGRQNVVLRDAHLNSLLRQAVRPKRQGAAGAEPRSLPGVRPAKPRGQEDTEQLSQIASELRELLSSKLKAPEGGAAGGAGEAAGSSSTGASS